MSCGVGCRHGSDPTLQWLWHRLAATAPIGPLAWELPYATGMALKKKITTKLEKEAKKKERRKCYKGILYNTWNIAHILE